MHIAYYKEFSNILNQEMEYKVYGHAGKPCLVFPAQDGNFFDYENYGMIDSVASFIEEGKLQLFCIQPIDQNTWSSFVPDEARRIELHENWFSYLCDELMPRLYAIHNNTAKEEYKGKFLTTGVSMGAFHALNIMLRHPELFDGTIALSGLYHASYFFPNYQEHLTYMNSPIDYLANMDKNHPYIDLYKQSRITICCGQGDWEDEAIKDAHILKDLFARLEVPVWIDLWGQDVNHDWPWWRKQFPYYVGKILASTTESEQ